MMAGRSEGIIFGASGTTCWAAFKSRFESAPAMAPRIPQQPVCSSLGRRVARQCAYLRRRVVRYYLALPVARCPLPVAASRWNIGAVTPANAMVYVRITAQQRAPGALALRHWAKERLLKGASSSFRSLVGAVGIVCGGGCRTAKASLRPVIVVLSPHQAEHNGRECAHSAASAIFTTFVSAAAELVCSACSRRLMYFQSASSI